MARVFIDGESMLFYDQDHLFLELLKRYPYAEGFYVVIPQGLKVYEESKEVLDQIWRKYSASVEFGSVLEVLKKTSAKRILVSSNKQLMNAVADSVSKVRFVVPYSISNGYFAQSLIKRGYRADTIVLLTRREGALARVLKVSFEDFLKVKELALGELKQKVLEHIKDGEEKEEREFIKELISKGVISDAVKGKYVLAKLVIEKRLRAEQREGKVYYTVRGDTA